MHHKIVTINTNTCVSLTLGLLALRLPLLYTGHFSRYTGNRLQKRMFRCNLVQFQFLSVLNLEDRKTPDY